MNNARSNTLFLMSVLIFAILFIILATGFANNYSFGIGGAAVSVFPGDFNGENFIFSDNGYYADDQFFDMPYPTTNSTGFSLRAAFNRRFFTGEIQYAQSTHTKEKSSIFYEPEGSMTFSFIDFTAKFNLPILMIDLYLLTGMHYAILNVENGELYGDGRNNDAFYYGAGFNIGAGISYYFTPFTSIYGEYVYRMTAFSQVNDVELGDTVYPGGSGALLFGISFHIPTGF